MTSDLLDVMKEEGAKAYPHEACGYVIRKGKKSLAVPCVNASETPRNHFLIDAQERHRVESMGEIVGVWHTHVDEPPTPSAADRVGCENSDLPWFILGVNGPAGSPSFSELVTLEPEGFELPYLERPYAFGVLDCWSLVRDFYRREYAIALGDYPRIEDFWLKGMDFFGQGWKEQGFRQLIDQEPAAGDLFLIQTDASGLANHIAIYLGDEVILHHCHGRLSRRDIYGGYWQKHTVIHLRHATKC